MTRAEPPEPRGHLKHDSSAFLLVAGHSLPSGEKRTATPHQQTLLYPRVKSRGCGVGKVARREAPGQRHRVHCLDRLPSQAITGHHRPSLGHPDSEVLFQDLGSDAYKKEDRYRKIKFCAKQAARDQLHDWEASFKASKWFRRGWTLQELIAPVSVEFFSCEGRQLGDKTSLEQLVHKITSIPLAALRNCPLDQFTTSERMRWPENRETTEEEDNVHCVLPSWSS
ncbi:hypothetical protein EK21DRAFT_95696 [Setomelanomma holmii]|uniref:Heterokaryon incompatibility domain-containing protein n=1 Tax=Setomelanomma holmii TaxID=210430 RepID=A0A9P4LEP8_9PLEO|nr:hypothetical protein EK21DRAFT_95696 [Setomelanomma holmii]